MLFPKESARKKEKKREGPTNLGYGYTYYDLLALPPPVSSLVASVPRPRAPKLRKGLPLWTTTPLDTKLPLMTGPHGPITFTRAKLGEKLWRNFPGRDFQLGSEAGVHFEYDAMHDHHLRAWLHRPETVAFLRRQGLVTPPPRLEPTCSVNQYNAFRSYLYTLFRDALRAEAYHRENQIMEQLLINAELKNATKEITKLRKFEESREKRNRNLQEIDYMNKERLEKCKKRLQRVLDQAKRAEEKKQAQVIEQKKRVKAIDEKIKSRIITANDLERKKKIKAMKLWHKQDVEKKRQFEKRKQQRELETQQKTEARWNRKVEEQNRQIAKEKYLRQQKALSKEQFQNQYMERMKNEWKKIEDELNSRKSRETVEKLKFQKRKKSMKQIMFSVSEAFIKERKSVGRLSQDEETNNALRQHVQQILKEIRYDLEPYIVIAHAKDRLEKQENVPLGVSGAITFMLEQTIVEYTARQLSQTITTAANKVLTAIDDLMEQSDAHSVTTKKSSAVVTGKRSSLSGKTARISEAEVIPLQKQSEELTVEVENLRRTRDRPPTPMPSISTFTAIVFNESTKEEFEEDPYDEYTFIEQGALKTTIANVTKRIYKMIPSRVKAVVHNLNYDRLSISSADGVAENKPVAKLCSMILFETSTDDNVLIPVVDQIIIKFMQSINLTPSYLRLKIKQVRWK